MVLIGKTVVITGASAGVGRATARRFAAEGANIALLARGRDGLESAVAEIERMGVRALALPVDVADPKQVEAAADAVERELGPIDIWVNNAMVSVFMPFEDMDAADFRRVTEVSYLGYVYGTMAALDRMRSSRRGHVIQVGSALAYRGIPLQSAYCGAKHAIEGFTESVRTELLHDNVAIKLSMVHLPALNTPQFGWVKTNCSRHPQPVPPIYEPEVAADAIVWCAQTRRSDVLVGLPTVMTVLANKVAPRLLDRYLARNGFDSQQTDDPIEEGRRNNLYEAVPGDHGAHGKFGSRAHSRSVQMWFNKHRRSLATTALGGAAAVLAARRGP